MSNGRLGFGGGDNFDGLGRALLAIAATAIGGTFVVGRIVTGSNKGALKFTGIAGAVLLAGRLLELKFPLDPTSQQLEDAAKQRLYQKQSEELRTTGTLTAPDGTTLIQRIS
jgi:hypothetical protein